MYIVFVQEQESGLGWPTLISGSGRHAQRAVEDAMKDIAIGTVTLFDIESNRNCQRKRFFGGNNAPTESVMLYLKRMNDGTWPPLSDEYTAAILN